MKSRKSKAKEKPDPKETAKKYQAGIWEFYRQLRDFDAKEIEKNITIKDGLNLILQDEECLAGLVGKIDRLLQDINSSRWKGWSKNKIPERFIEARNVLEQLPVLASSILADRNFRYPGNRNTRCAKKKTRRGRHSNASKALFLLTARQELSWRLWFVWRDCGGGSRTTIFSHRKGRNPSLTKIGRFVEAVLEFNPCPESITLDNIETELRALKKMNPDFEKI